jgi:hypothetical protein
MGEKETQFNNFLNETDKEYSEYFNSLDSNFKSIRKCFATLNHVILVYRKSSKLRKDIFDKVLKEHKEIYEDKSIISYEN